MRPYTASEYAHIILQAEAANTAKSRATIHRIARSQGYASADELKFYIKQTLKLYIEVLRGVLKKPITGATFEALMYSLEGVTRDLERLQGVGLQSDDHDTSDASESSDDSDNPDDSDDPDGSDGSEDSDDPSDSEDEEVSEDEEGSEDEDA